jgi:molybdopterin-guanine dinucleotide biosynthesis protein A
MATDKARIVWQGETLAARAARVLSTACAPVIEVGSGATALRCVREDPPGAGPLAALIAGARALGSPGPVVLLACDLPFVEPPILALLANWPGRPSVIPVVDGRLQYACARYGPDALARAEVALEAGDHALRAAAGDDCDELSEAEWRAVAPAHAFADVDTPTDLRRLGLS